jgi:amino-acid N-acetyltransferase
VLLRNAEERDVPAILGLINDYARRNLLLPRSEESLRARLADFVVAETEGGIAGCCALSELGPALGEIRSLAVREDMSGQGIGRALVEHSMARAWARGFHEVLALTRRVSFFEGLGFLVTRRERYLDKLATDCVACPLNLCCDETAVVWFPPEARAAVTEETHARRPDSGGNGNGEEGGAAWSRGDSGRPIGGVRESHERSPLLARMLPVPGRGGGRAT